MNTPKVKLKPRLRLMRQLVGPRSYIGLLISLCLLGLLSASTTDGPYSRAAITFLSLFLVTTITVATDQNRRMAVTMLIVGLTISIMLIVSNVFMVPPMHTKTFRMTSDILALIYLLYASFLIIRDVFSGQVNVNRICGAICFYLMIGMSFGMFFFVLDMHDATSFKIDQFYHGTAGEGLPISIHDRFTLFTYFSFCTISTAGFGDITPVSQMARTFSWMEAIFGQLYLSILVARLVGLHIADSTSNAAKDPEEPMLTRDIGQ
ncbi:MAG: two pore domain potassium channel family protein [Cyanobacteria bacterium SZAS LIN-3]|nr:two pore domain potassium channel family protein [Cyanobacteria bacterium SZAS LIN-3]